MSYCKVCAASYDVRAEELLDGRRIYLCGVCRRYLQGLLKTCETCADHDVCVWSDSFDNAFTCDSWKDSAGQSRVEKA